MIKSIITIFATGCVYCNVSTNPAVFVIEQPKPSTAEVLQQEFSTQRSERMWGRMFSEGMKNKKLTDRVKRVLSGYNNSTHEEYMIRIKSSGFPLDIQISLEDLYCVRKINEDKIINKFKHTVIPIFSKNKVDLKKSESILALSDNYGEKKKVLNEIDDLTIPSDEKNLLKGAVTDLCKEAKKIIKHTRDARDTIAKSMG